MSVSVTWLAVLGTIAILALYEAALLLVRQRNTPLLIAGLPVKKLVCPVDGSIFSRLDPTPDPRGMMKYCKRLAFAAAMALTAIGIHAEQITEARFAAPVDRYGHFALGRPHEYARVTATTDTGRHLTFDLPEDEVFEDMVPRIVELAAGEPKEILAVVSKRDSGSRLMLLRLSVSRLEISAQSVAIGTPMRWLNPVGVADLDGDGRAEIAAVITPHIGGTLKVYRKKGNELVEIAALDGFSNHVYLTPELALSLPFSIGGRTRLLVPSATRLQLRIVGLENGRLTELGHCSLRSRLTGAIRVMSPTEVSLGLVSGRQNIAPKDCPK